MTDYSISSILSRHYSDSVQREIFNAAKNQLGVQQIQNAVNVEKLTSLEAENANLKQKVQFLEKQNIDLSNSLNNALLGINQTKNDFSEIKNDLQAQIQSLTSELKNTQNDLKITESKLNSVEKENIKMEAKYIQQFDSEMQKKVEGTANENNRLKAEISIMKQTKQDDRNTNNNKTYMLESEFDTLRTRYLNGDTRDRVAGFDILAARKDNEEDLTANQLRKRANELQNSSWKEKTRLEWALEE